MNTVALAKQQKECIERATSFKTAVYTGDMNVDVWSNDQWDVEFEKYQVIIDFLVFTQSHIDSFNLLGFGCNLSNNSRHHSASIHRNGSHKFDCV